MHVGVDVCIIPFGSEGSLSQYVAECQRIFDKAGLKYSLHGSGTEVEGEWEEVMNAVQECHKSIHGMGAPRIATTMKVYTRTDKTQSFEEKVQRVQKVLEAQQCE
jgi:uncharacterized protein (TIGR00106 family)